MALKYNRHNGFNSSARVTRLTPVDGDGNPATGRPQREALSGGSNLNSRTPVSTLQRPATTRRAARSTASLRSDARSTIPFDEFGLTHSENYFNEEPGKCPLATGMIPKPFSTATQSDSTLSLFMQKCKTLNHFKQIHAHLLKLYLPETPSSIAPLLSFAVSSKNPAFFSYACAIFQNLHFRSTFVYNAMIRGNVQYHFPVPAILCYKEMLSCKLIVNNYTFTPLIKACSMVLDDFREMGFSVHAQILKLGFQQDCFIASALIEFYSLALDMEKASMLFDEISERDVVMWTTMIDGYGKIGAVEKARKLFEEMPDRNVISWSTILAAYSRVSDFKEVMVLYRQMEEVGMRPNESVLVTAVTACAHLGSLEQGLWIHSLAKRYGYDSNLILATALVDMYSKCGRMDFALSVFEGISCKDTGAWNAILSGFAMNGDALKTLHMFDKMVSSRAQPNETTFTSLLSACTHAKLIDSGLLLFHKMSSVYGVKPRFEHHACVVDLLARAGKLEEAEKFIDEKMGGIDKCDPNVWGALLSACRVYGNVEIGNRLWRKLVNTRTTNYGTHMLSYIMYKEAGWDAEAKSVRQLIEIAGMKKKPGCSSIEVNGVVEEFLAGDLLHPKAREMCSILDSLLANVMYHSKETAEFRFILWCII